MRIQQPTSLPGDKRLLPSRRLRGGPVRPDPRAARFITFSAVLKINRLDVLTQILGMLLITKSSESPRPYPQAQNGVDLSPLDPVRLKLFLFPVFFDGEGIYLGATSFRVGDTTLCRRESPRRQRLQSPKRTRIIPDPVVMREFGNILIASSPALAHHTIAIQ